MKKKDISKWLSDHRYFLKPDNSGLTHVQIGKWQLTYPKKIDFEILLDNLILAETETNK